MTMRRGAPDLITASATASSLGFATVVNMKQAAVHGFRVWFLASGLQSNPLSLPPS